MKKLSILDHMKELRYRLFFCISFVVILSIIVYCFYDIIYLLLANPFAGTKNEIQKSFFINSVMEGVLIKFKFSFLFGLILSIPVCLYHILRFAFPGLKKKEKTILIISIIASSILSIFGFVYSYFLVIPTSIRFLISQHFIPESVGVLLTYSDNVFFVFNLLIYLILVFQFPILLCVFAHLKIVNLKKLLSSSRFIIVLIFALSAIITPPDVITQLMISIPLIGLFFISLLFIKLFKLGET